MFIKKMASSNSGNILQDRLHHLLSSMKNTLNTFGRIFADAEILVSIRRTTGFELFYITIATVTINLIVAVAIVL